MQVIHPTGLTYHPSWISEEEVAGFVELIYFRNWDTTLSRRVQHYGWIYDYRARRVTQRANPIPEELQGVMARLAELTGQTFDQLIVNEYVRDQGIGPHTDLAAFDDVIACISLGGSRTINFTHPRNAKWDQQVNDGDLIVMQGPARHYWKHSIRGDHSAPPRVSLTFRRVK